MASINKDGYLERLTILQAEEQQTKDLKEMREKDIEKCTDELREIIGFGYEITIKVKGILNKYIKR